MCVCLYFILIFQVVSVGDFVYGCGLNNYGQLGLGNTQNRKKLARIASLDGHCIVSVKG